MGETRRLWCPVPRHSTDGRCIGEACAWWVGGERPCAVAAIATARMVKARVAVIDAIGDRSEGNNDASDG